ncbi:hypothetical protein CRS_26550 [Chryseobacterium sp. ON_d1]|nr:hypothetical protein CRS_26550 [Chryseobacterium sp. ON_d1]
MQISNYSFIFVSTKTNNMKTTLIIIAYTLLLIGGLATAAILNPAKTEVKSKNFVGIDAVGVKHGAGAKSTIKYH